MTAHGGAVPPRIPPGIQISGCFGCGWAAAFAVLIFFVGVLVGRGLCRCQISAAPISTWPKMTSGRP